MNDDTQAKLDEIVAAEQRALVEKKCGLLTGVLQNLVCRRGHPLDERLT